jgi:hypothetical protein
MGLAMLRTAINDIVFFRHEHDSTVRTGLEIEKGAAKNRGLQVRAIDC